MKKNIFKFMGSLLLSISVFGCGIVHAFKWNTFNDFKLLKNVEEFTGENWLVISKKVFKGKCTPTECQDRYMSYLKPNFECVKNWNVEELKSLHRKVYNVGEDWEQLQEIFGVPSAVLAYLYFKTYNTYDHTLDDSCVFLPKALWVKPKTVRVCQSAPASPFPPIFS